MPCGLLKLKSCGVGSSKLMPQSVQAKWEERTMSPGWVPAARRFELRVADCGLRTVILVVVIRSVARSAARSLRLRLVVAASR